MVDRLLALMEFVMAIARSFAAFCEQALDLTRDVYNEFRYGVRTGGYGDGQPGSAQEPSRLLFPDNVGYHPTPYREINWILDCLDLRPDDVIFDLGCGKGRVVFCAALRRVRSCVGVEFRPELAAAARRNLKRLSGASRPVEIVECDAARADLDAGTVFFMFNPFGFRTLQVVVDRLEESLKRRPRRIRIAYHNPVHNWYLDDRPWLKGIGWLTRGTFAAAGTFAWESKEGAP
jgi:SAM-dependent methyltransferase